MTQIGSEAESHEKSNYVGIGFLIFLIILAAVFTFMAIGYGLTAEGSPMGPGAAPAALGTLLMIGTTVLLWREFSSAKRAAVHEGSSGRVEGTKPGGAGKAQNGKELVKPLLILLILAAGLALTPITGMMIAMALAVMAVAIFIEKIKPVSALIMSAVAALMLWLVFDQLLSVRFPDSIIGL